MPRCQAFLKDDRGAVTVDFVVLAAAVVAMAMLIYPTLVTPVSDMAVYIGDTVTKYDDYLNND